MTTKQFFKNRWHLHLLTMPIALVVVHLINKYNFLDLNNTGDIFKVFVITFVAGCVAFAIERVQGIKIGGLKTQEQQKASDLDMLVGILGALVGSIVGVTVL